MPKRRPRRRPPEDERERYALVVTAWDYHYGFRVGDGSSFHVGPFSEIAVLTFKGDVIRPEDCKYRHAEVTIYVREGLLEDHTREPAPSVGGVDARNDWLGAYAWLPVERLDGLIAVAAAKRFKVIALDTTRIFRRRARLRGVRFYTELEEEDL